MDAPTDAAHRREPGTVWSIGFVAPLSFGEAVVAVPMLEAVRRGAASGAAAARRCGATVQVLALDDRRDPERAAGLVGRLAADPSVIGVVGPKNSGCARAAIPVARAAGLPLLLPAATADDLCRLGAGWVFRLCAADAATAAAAAALCLRLGIGRLAVIADATPYGIGLAAGVGDAARAVGIEVGHRLDGCGAVFHAMGEVEQAEAIRAARAAGFRGALLGAEGGPGAALPALAGPDAEGAFELYAGAPAAGAATVYAAEAEDAARLLVEAAAATHAPPDPGGTPAARGDGRAAAATHATAGAPAPQAPSAARRRLRAALAAAEADGRSGRVGFTPEGERRDAAVSLWRVRSGTSVAESEVEPAGGTHPC
jgi:ABC-type branched-subunit amino acid transport system substrate-binding protein